MAHQEWVQEDRQEDHQEDRQGDRQVCRARQDNRMVLSIHGSSGRVSGTKPILSLWTDELVLGMTHHIRRPTTCRNRSDANTVESARNCGFLVSPHHLSEWH
jgi:hypothetical protein